MHTKPKLKNVQTMLNNRSFITQIHPRRIYLLMNLVYKMTNSNSNELVEAKATKIVLDYNSDIVEWFIKRYDRKFQSTRQTALAKEAVALFNDTLQQEESIEAYQHAASWFEVLCTKWRC